MYQNAIKGILTFNAITDTTTAGDKTILIFGLRSLINHSDDTNIKEVRKGSTSLLYAKRDIQKGE